MRAFFENTVEPAKKAFLFFMMAFGDRFEQRGAQSRRQRQRQKSGKSDGKRHGQRKLAINVAGRTAEHRHRHEDGNQHRRDADHRTGNLPHRFLGRLFGRQSFLRHDPLDVFHDDDGIIDNDADNQHHGEHSHHVDRHAQGRNSGECAQQRDRHNDGRNDGVTEILQKDEHHNEHQPNSLKQRADHFFDRERHELRGIVGRCPFHAFREELLQFVHSGFHRFCRRQRITAVGKQNGHTRIRLAVQARRSPVRLAAQLDTGHVF